MSCTQDLLRASWSLIVGGALPFWDFGSIGAPTRHHTNFGLSEGNIYNLGWRGRFMYDSEQIQMIEKLYMEVRADHI